MPTLNNETVAKLPLAVTGQYIERDDKLPGFFVVVGKRSKTFTVQVDGKKPDGTRTSRREKVGTFPEMSASVARERAKALQIALGKRRDPEVEDKPNYTLGRGWAAYRDLMVRKVEDGVKSAATLANYDRAYLHVEDWAERPLAEISASAEMVQLRFRDITDGKVIGKTLRGGKGAANLVAVFLGVVYRYVQDSGLQRDLPDFVPSRAVRHERIGRGAAAWTSSPGLPWMPALRQLQQRAGGLHRGRGLCGGGTCARCGPMTCWASLTTPRCSSCRGLTLPNIWAAWEEVLSSTERLVSGM